MWGTIRASWARTAEHIRTAATARFMVDFDQHTIAKSPRIAHRSSVGGPPGAEKPLPDPIFPKDTATGLRRRVAAAKPVAGVSSEKFPAPLPSSPLASGARGMGGQRLWALPPVPTDAWREVVQCDATTRRALYFMWLLVGINMAVWAGLFHLSRGFLPQAEFLENVTSVSALGFAFLSLMNVSGQRAFQIWSDRTGNAPWPTPVRRLNWLFWTVSGFANSASSSITIFIVYGLFLVVTAHIATGGHLGFLLSLSIVPLYSVMRDGVSTAAWAMVALILFVCVAVFGILNPDLLAHNRMKQREYDLVVELFICIGNMFFLWLNHNLLAYRSRQSKQYGALWSDMLQFDVRTPLHGLINVAADLRAVDPKATMIAQLAEAARCLFENAAAPQLGSSRRLAEDHVSLFDLCQKLECLLIAMGRTQSHSTELFFGKTPFSECSRDGVPNVRFPHHTTEGDLLQVLVNLISNAVKFTPPSGSICVKLKYSQNLFVCVVEDSGKGVPPESRNMIFASYQRGPGAHVTEGIGLGLSVVKSLVEKAGGTVRVTDRRQEPGAKFVIAIPCQGCLSDAESPVDARATDQLDRSHRNVLIVDDNALNTVILKRLFVSVGFDAASLFTFASAESALEYVAANDTHLDMCVLDYVLPGMNGVELAQELGRLRQLNPLPMIGSSATASAKVWRQWWSAGVHYFLSKPFDKHQFSRIVTAVESGRQQRPPKEKPQSSTSEPWEVVTDKAHAVSWMHFVAGFVCLAFCEFRIALLMFLAGLAYAAAAWYVESRDGKFVKVLMLLTVLSVTVRALLTGCRPRSGFATTVLLGASLESSGEWAALAVLGTVGFHTLAYFDMDQVGVCAPVIALSPGETVLIIDGLGMLIVFALFAVDISIASRARRQMDWWGHALSHDLRAPLHGVFALLQDFEASVQPALVVQHARGVKATASVLLATVDTVLRLAEPMTPFYLRGNPPVPMVDIARFLRTELELVMHTAPDTSKLSDAENSDVELFLQRSPLFYVLSSFVQFVALELGEMANVSATISLRGSKRRQLAIEVTAVGIVFPEAILERTRSSILFSQALNTLLEGTLEIIEPSENTIGLALLVPVKKWQTATTRPSRKQLLGGVDTVLVVDDNPLHRKIASKMLHGAGVTHVHNFATSDEFCEYVRSNPTSSAPPHVALLDMHLPNFSGAAAWRDRLAELPEGDQLVLVACTGDSSAAARSIAAGFHGALCKPFSALDLQRSIVAALARRGERPPPKNRRAKSSPVK
jgi:CheY-like chemotaxis protein/signal transduction histidine kinase